MRTRIHSLRAGDIVVPEIGSESIDERVVVDVTRTSARYYRITWDDGTTTRRGPKAAFHVVGFVTEKGRYELRQHSAPDDGGVTDWSIQFTPHNGGPGTWKDIATFFLYPDGLVEINGKHYELHIETTFDDALHEAVEQVETKQAWLAHKGIEDTGDWMWRATAGPWMDMPASWRPEGERA